MGANAGTTGDEVTTTGTAPTDGEDDGELTRGEGAHEKRASIDAKDENARVRRGRDDIRYGYHEACDARPAGDMRAIDEFIDESMPGMTEWIKLMTESMPGMNASMKSIDGAGPRVDFAIKIREPGHRLWKLGRRP